MTVVADTHAVVCHLTDPDRLGRGARRALADVDAGQWACQVPVIMFVEIGLLSGRGRLRVGPVQVLQALARHPGYSAIGLDVEQVVEFGTLTAIRDPMDRLILAATRVTGPRLSSADEALGGHGVERLWD